MKLGNPNSLMPLKLLIISFHASNTILVSFLPLYLQFKGLTGGQIGIVLAVESLASIIAQPFWGYLSDKFKTVKKILIVLVFGLLAFSLLFFEMDGLTMIIVTGAAFYFFATPVGALADSLAQRRSTDLGISFGSIRMWGSVGFAISSLIVGSVLERFGIQYMIIPYLLFGISALIATFNLKDVPVETAPVNFKDLGMLVKNKPFLIFLCIMLFLTITHRTNDYYMALYIKELGGGEDLVGLAWFMGVIAEAVVFAFAWIWYRKFHPLVFMTVAGVLFTIRWFIYAGVTDPLIIIGLQFMHGLTFGIFYIASFDYVSRLIPSFLQSTGHLLFYAMFFGFSGIIGSLVGGPLIEVLGGSALYTVLGFAALFGTILLFVYHVITRKRAI